MEIMANQVGFVVRLTQESSREPERYTKTPYAEWLKEEAVYRAFPVLTLSAGPGYTNPVWEATSRHERMNGKNIWFCIDEAEAEQAITDRIAAEFKRVFFDRTNRHDYEVRGAIALAQRSGRPAPVEALRWLVENELTGLRNSRAQRLETLKTDEPKIAALEAKLAEFPAAGGGK
jgi:hypothetical protein